jgi:hypothetical protein
VREKAGDRFFIETADALIPAEHFRYRKLGPQDYLREDWFTDPYEQGIVDDAPPDRPQPAKVKALPAKHGAQERPEWKEIVPHLKARFDAGPATQSQRGVSRDRRLVSGEGSNDGQQHDPERN